jgi:hypothetical protein
MNVRYSPAVTLKPPVQEALGSQSLGLLSAVFFFCVHFFTSLGATYRKGQVSRYTELALSPASISCRKKKKIHPSFILFLP